MTAQKPQGQPTKLQEAVARAIHEVEGYTDWDALPFSDSSFGTGKHVRFAEAQAAIRATLDELMNAVLCSKHTKRRRTRLWLRKLVMIAVCGNEFKKPSIGSNRASRFIRHWAEVA